MNSALQQTSLHWAQKAAIYVFSSGIFLWGLDRSIPSFDGFIRGLFACHGG